MLHILPVRTGAAAENMALDFLLLQRYPAPAAPRFRHYEWRRPAFTFGYSQKIGFVRANLPPCETFDLCRRPTGGGIVDHRYDWTYTLVLPRGHALYDERAAQSYRIVHECLADGARRSRPAGGGENRVCEPCEVETGAPRGLKPARSAGSTVGRHLLPAGRTLRCGEHRDGREDRRGRPEAEQAWPAFSGFD